MTDVPLKNIITHILAKIHKKKIIFFSFSEKQLPSWPPKTKKHTGSNSSYVLNTSLFDE
jgi:hypothetical protein